MAAQARPGHGVIFTPWLYGERTPVEDRFVRGGFHNLSLSASRDDLVRAVFEGVALNARWLLRPWNASPGTGWSRSGHRRRRAQRRVVPDLRRRARPRHRAGRRPVNANARGAGLLARSRSRAHLQPGAGAGQVAGAYQPSRVPGSSTTSCSPSSSALPA